jgi:PPOX class probable F420-dependent enzyme
MLKQEYPAWMGKMRGLTPGEIKAFLAEPVVARVATIKPDGSPYVVPVWQEYDGQVLYFIPREKSAFIIHIKAEPRICISCALDNAPYTRVVFEGKAEIVEGPKPMEGLTMEIARRMAVRYLGERGPEYLEPSQPRPRYLVKLVPEKITSWEGVEWHPKYLDEGDES